MGKAALLILALSCSTANAAFEHSPHGARAVGLAGATVAIEGDLWSAFVNPSCLPVAGGTIVAAEYFPALFGLPEIKRGAIVIDRTFPFGPMSISMSGLGFDLYREMSVGVAAGYELNERIVLGIGVSLYSLSIQDYGSDQALGVDVGALVRLGAGICYGVSLHGVNRPAVGADEEPLPQTMTMGISASPIPAATLAVSAGKDSHYPFELSVGAEYCLENLLTLRLGVCHEPSTVAAGITVRTSLLCLDYAYSMHPDLGGTHCFSVSFDLPWP